MTAQIIQEELLFNVRSELHLQDLSKNFLSNPSSSASFKKQSHPQTPSTATIQMQTIMAKQ